MAVVAGLVIGALIVILLATQFFGFHVLAVQSSSMSPALKRGDLIITRPASILDVNSGQIALFREKEGSKILIAHRVIATIDETVNTTSQSTGKTTQNHSRVLNTKGDANTVADPTPVNAARLRGVVWFSIPNAGAFIGGWHVQQWFIAIMLLSALGWCAYEAFRYLRRRSQAQPGGGLS